MTSEHLQESGREALERYLRKLGAINVKSRSKRGGSNGKTAEPVPTTRELGQRFEISNTTAFRVVRQLLMEGVLCRRDNGRYYPASARELIRSHYPIAWPTRSFESWTSLLRDVMVGVTRGCGDLRNGILLVHDEGLVEQASVEEVAKLADEKTQREILTRFVERGDLLSGILLDEIWLDSVLDEFAEHFNRPVVIYRDTTLKSFGNVSADFETGALLALTHIQARGFEQIALATPLWEYIPDQRFLGCCRTQAEKQKYPLLSNDLYEFRASGQAFQQLVRDLKKTKQRTCIICPEDNGAVWLKKNLEAEFSIGDEVGIVSAMGTTIAREAGVSSICYDFVEMGAQAVRMMLKSELSHVKLGPQLFFGNTT